MTVGLSDVAAFSAVLHSGAGCRPVIPDPSRVAIADTAVATDAGDIGRGGPDGLTQPRRCTWTGSFSFEVRPLASVNSDATEREPHLSRDATALYFASNRNAGDWDPFVSVRDTPTAPWGIPTVSPAVATVGYDGRFSLTADERTAFLASSRTDSNGVALWIASRAVADGVWPSSNFTRLVELDTAADEYDPFPSPDGARLYYSPRTTAPEQQNIVVAERSAPDKAFAAPRPLMRINSPALDDNPALTDDELLITFSSTRGGAGAPDVYYAIRASRDEAFGSPQPVPGLNTAAAEDEAFVTPDGCEIYFASDRPGSQTDGRDLYHAVYNGHD